MRPVTALRRRSGSRWIWSLSGLVTVAVLAIPGTRLITGAGVPAGGKSPVSVAPGRTVIVPQRVTSLDAESYGAQIQVTAGPVRHVRITETIMYAPAEAVPPAVTESVSDGRLTLDAPACRVSGCSVGFAVTVPADVTVTAASDGGPVIVSGIAGANLDSGGGTVHATGIRGPLTAHTDGGALLLDGLTGPLYAETGGGPLLARGVAAAATAVSTDGGDADIEFTAAARTVTVSSGGGGTQLWFTAAPRAVTVGTDGGAALLIVPGGPYAVTASSDGGPQFVGIAIDPAARRTLSVASGGGPLQIEPVRAGTSAPSTSSAASTSPLPPIAPAPPVPPAPFFAS